MMASHLQQQQQQQRLHDQRKPYKLLSVFFYVLLLLLSLFFMNIPHTDAVSIRPSSSTVKLDQQPSHRDSSSYSATTYRPFHFPSSPAKLCKQCYSTADEVRACLADIAPTTKSQKHCNPTALTKDEVMQLCALSRQRVTPDTVYCDGLNALRKRRRKSTSSSSCKTQTTMDMPDYVMLNGIEVLFIRYLYAAGIDVASKLLQVLEFPPWYMSILSTSTSTSTRIVSDRRRRRTSLTGEKMVRSSTDNIRPIVAQFKIESEGEKFQDTVKRAFQRMRKRKGFEDIRGDIRRDKDGNVFIVFYFEREHLIEY